MVVRPMPYFACSLRYPQPCSRYSLIICSFKSIKWLFFNQPISGRNKLMMKLTTKVHLYSSARAKADSEQKDKNIFVSQHSSKPNVTSSCSSVSCQVHIFLLL